MSRYIGWDMEAMRRDGIQKSPPPEEISSTIAPQMLSTPSFTPINHGGTSFKTAPTLVRRRSGEFEETSQIQSPKAKRRKTEPTVIAAIEREVLQSDEVNTVLGPNQIPNSLHLGPQPKSKPGKKKQTSKAKPVISESQQEVFSDAKVTKAKQPSRKNTGKKLNEVNNYVGFITTEEKLKAKIHHSQTTLDKLAAFRYIPPEPESQQANATNTAVIPDSVVEREEFSEFLDYEGAGYNALAALQNRDPEDFEPPSDSHFEDAYFADEIHFPHVDSEDIQDQPTSAEPVLKTAANHVMKETCLSQSQFDVQAGNKRAVPQDDLQDQTSIPITSNDITEDAMIEGEKSRSNVANTPPSPTLVPPCKNWEDGAVQDGQAHAFDNPEFSHLTVETGHLTSGNSNPVLREHSRTATSMIQPNLDSEQNDNCDAMDFDYGETDDEDLYALIAEQEQEVNDCNMLPVKPVTLGGSSRPPLSTNQLPLKNSVRQVDASTFGDIVNAGGKLPASEDEFSMDEIEEEVLRQLPAGTVHETRPPSFSIPFPSEGEESRDLEVYDRNLQYSDPGDAAPVNANGSGVVAGTGRLTENAINSESSEESWSFLGNRKSKGKKSHKKTNQRLPLSPMKTAATNQVRCPSQGKPATPKESLPLSARPDSDEAVPLAAFARPEFPIPMLDRSPVIGFSNSLVLRTCFRIGEAFRVAAVSDSSEYDILLELFARVTFSSREEGSVKQHFQFGDLFHERPPYLNGVLENYKVTDLANTESRQLVGGSGTWKLVRCLARAKREYKGKRVLIIENIRLTDWEEIDRSKRIYQDLYGKAKIENGDGSSGS